MSHALRTTQDWKLDSNIRGKVSQSGNKRVRNISNSDITNPSIATQKIPPHVLFRNADGSVIRGKGLRQLGHYDVLNKSTYVKVRVTWYGWTAENPSLISYLKLTATVYGFDALV